MSPGSMSTANSPASRSSLSAVTTRRSVPWESVLIQSMLGSFSSSATWFRVAARTERKKVGVLATDAEVYGGFDYQTMRSNPPWSIVKELEKQYDVRSVSPDGPISNDLDGLLVILPSTLSQSRMDNLKTWLLSGKPTLLIIDPLPVVNVGLSPVLPAGSQANPFQRQQQQPPPKGDINSLLQSIGVRWNNQFVVWDAYNPHPELSALPSEIVFVGPGNGVPDAFNSEDMITQGLQEVVMLYPGYVFQGTGKTYAFEPLLRSGRSSGTNPWNALVQRSFFGMSINRNVRHQPTNESYVFGARISGSNIVDMGNTPDTAALPQRDSVNAVVLADVDMISEQFFVMRERGFGDFNFDNVSFVLNCMDVLMGDTSFVALRNKRVKHRTLETVEAQTADFLQQRFEDDKKAEDDAQVALDDAQARLDAKVAEVRNRTDLDDRTKQIMMRNLQEVENRHFEVVKQNIEAQKEARIEAGKVETEQQIRKIESRIKTLAVCLPPIPVFVIGVMVFVRRRRKEQEGAAAARRLRS